MEEEEGEHIAFAQKVIYISPVYDFCTIVGELIIYLVLKLLMADATRRSVVVDTSFKLGDRKEQEIYNEPKCDGHGREIIISDCLFDPSILFPRDMEPKRFPRDFAFLLCDLPASLNNWVSLFFSSSTMGSAVPSCSSLTLTICSNISIASSTLCQNPQLL